MIEESMAKVNESIDIFQDTESLHVVGSRGMTKWNILVVIIIVFNIIIYQPSTALQIYYMAS